MGPGAFLPPSFLSFSPPPPRRGDGGARDVPDARSDPSRPAQGFCHPWEAHGDHDDHHHETDDATADARAKEYLAGKEEAAH